MSISDRLDEIRDRYVEWHQDRGDHTPAPNTETWADADHPGESMEHCIVRNDVPWLVQAVRRRDSALRAVLGLHTESRFGPDLPHPYCGECGQMLPCPTVRAITAALGEES